MPRVDITAFSTLDIPVSMGGYEAAHKPDEPIVVHMMKTPCRPGHPARDEHRIGRGELFSTPLARCDAGPAPDAPDGMASSSCGRQSADLVCAPLHTRRCSPEYPM